MKIKTALLLLFLTTTSISMFSQINQNDENAKSNLLDFFSDADFYNDLIYQQVLVKNEIELFSLSENSKALRIGIIPKNTNIILLAQTRSYNETEGVGYFLVKDTRDSFYWSGWIRKQDITEKVIEKHPRFMLYKNFINPSSNNEFIAFSKNEQLFVMNKKGICIASIPIKEIQKKYPDAFDGYFIGWSDNNEYIWFETNLDSSIACFGRLNTKTGNYVLLDCPKNFEGNEIIIDFNNGNVIYSDFPYQYDTESAEETRKSMYKYSLYKTNFFDNVIKLVDVNHGTGFDIKEENGNFFYRKNENAVFKMVDFK